MNTRCPQLIASPCPFHPSSSHAQYFPSVICLTLSRHRLFHQLPHPFLFTTHSSLIQPSLDTSHPDFSSVAIPSRHIASGIPPPPFHPDISHSEFLRRHSTRTSSHPEFLRRHSIRMSHTRNSSRRHSIRMPHTRNPIRRRSTFSGCLTSRILSSRRSTFFFILRAFSLGSKIAF